jgi:hypothetical protein
MKQRAYLFVLCDLYPHISRILRLQYLDDIRRQCLVPSFSNCHSILGLALDHTIVEFILVSECCLLAEFLDSVLLGLVVLGSKDIVFMLLEITEFLTVQELTSFSVITLRERVCTSALCRPGYSEGL